MRRIQNKKRYLLAFIIATVLFIMGFLITHSIAFFEYSRISNLQRDLSYDIFQDKIMHSLFDYDICEKGFLNEISADLGHQGRIIDDLEKKLGKNDKNVLAQKKFYTLVELEHFEFIQQLNLECNFSIPIILFFYSNEKDDIKESENVGDLLTAVYNQYPEVKIYSFDINLDSKLIDLLKEKYFVKVSPTIIIYQGGEAYTIINPKNIDSIIKHLH